MEKGYSFRKWRWENWLSTRKRMKLDSYSLPQSNINSKWIKDLNLRANAITIELWGENIGESFMKKPGQKIHDIGFGDEYLDMTPEAQATKEK